MANIVNSRDVMLEVGTRTADIIKSLYITSSATVFTYDSSGALSPATQVLTLTATKANTSNTVNWVTSPVVPLYNAATAGAVASSGDTIYLRSADFNTAGVNSVQVIANVIDGTGLTSSIGITKQVAASGGAAGTSATNSTVVRLFQWSITSPAGPTGTSTYTWNPGSNGTYSGSNWTSTVPTNPGNVNNNLWIASKTVASSAANATVLIDWTGATISLSSSGLYTNNATVSVYRWDSSAAVAPVITSSGTSVYTWATGVFTNPPTSWYAAPPVSPGAGLTLWAATVRITDATTSSTTTINWTTASASPTGATGATGATGSSVRTAYARIVNNPVAASGFVTEAGDALPTSAHSDNTWSPGFLADGITADTSFNVVWYTSDPTPTSTSSLYVSDGLYDPVANTTVWSTPYITSLKVGSLSAVAVNTGALTVNGILTMGTLGSIMGGKTSYASATAGFFLGYDSTGYKFNIGSSTSALTWDGTTLTVPAATITGTLGTTQITDGGITTDKLEASAVTSGKIASDAINAKQIQLTTDGFLAGGKTSFADTNAGFFFGYDATGTAGYKLKIGSGLTYANDVLTVSAITIGTDGAIGGIGSGNGSLIKNSSISISNAGVLSGAGGGTVTLNGIGYTGDTNATYGANWATNVTGASAVDTSIAAKLAKSGAQTLTGPIGLDSTTAIRVGTAALDSVAGHDGFYIGSSGIVATKNGVATVSIGSNGDAIFKGDITGASGNFSGNLSGANITGATGTFSGLLAAGLPDITKLVGTTTAFESIGNYNITCPSAEFSSMRVTIIGGGGGGGSDSGGTGNNPQWYASGGGGGGGLTIATTNAASGNYIIVVGAGGGIGQPGGNSSVSGAGMNATAAGGSGGSPSTGSYYGSTGGAGGGGTIGGTAGGTGVTSTDEYGGTYSIFGAGGNAGNNVGLGGTTVGANGGIPGGGGAGKGFYWQNPSAPAATYAGLGARGKVIVEFYNPNGVIIRSEWNALKTAITGSTSHGDLVSRVAAL